MLHTVSLGAPPVRLRERTTVAVIVVALHFAVLAAWLMQPPAASIPGRKMEVTVALAPVAAQIEKRPQQPPARIAPVQLPRDEAPAPLPTEPAAQQSNAPVAAAEPVANPVVAAPPEVEPDYKASYLNNHLTYPLAARRMGIQGRVVLNVEVLAEGMSGQMNVHQSSGHKELDRAALESVKNWRFVPASRAGQPFTKWFRVPIQFSLKDNEA
jgi:protein TonB